MTTMDNAAGEPLDPAIAQMAATTIERLNTSHGDTVLLIARHAAGELDAFDAEIVAIDRSGIDLAVHRHGPTPTRTQARVAFGEPVDDTAASLSTAFASLMALARERAGEGVPLTSVEREQAVTATLPTFVTEVIARRSLTPNLVEVVIGGDGLRDFAPAVGDQFFWAMAARDGGTPIDDGFTMADWLGATDTAARPFGGYYTVRRWDPTTHRITLWSVIHGGHDHGGHDHGDDSNPEGATPATGMGTWFARCTPGERIAIWGPRAGAPTPLRDDAHDHLFVTDESGFAAVCVLVEALPDGEYAHVVAETIDESHRIPFPGAATTVCWCHRAASEPGVGNHLLDAVRSLTGGMRLASAFGAAESRQVTAIRRYLRDEMGLGQESVSMTGYWRRDA